MSSRPFLQPYQVPGEAQYERKVTSRKGGTMPVEVGKPAPDVKAEYWVRGARSPNTLALSEFGGRWVVLFFYPRDFTFICPTEIAAFATLHADFERENAGVIGASTDSFYSHKAWFESDPRLKDVAYPVIADTSHEVSRQFGVLHEDGAAKRGTFIVDPEGILAYVAVTHDNVGRNVDDTLRVLQALRTGELCPAGWRPGQATLTGQEDWLAKAFPTLPDDVVERIAGQVERLEVPAGEVVIRQGEPADRLYVIARGDVEVTRHDPERGDVTIGRLGPGQFFGEVGLMTESRRTASVRADGPASLLALSRGAFTVMLQESEATAAELTRVVRERLAKT